MYDPPVTLTLIYSVNDIETVFSVPNIPLTEAYQQAITCAHIPVIEDNDFEYNEWKCIGFSNVRDVFRFTDADDIVVVRREDIHLNSYIYFVIYRYEEEVEDQGENVPFPLQASDYTSDTHSDVSSITVEEEDNEIYDIYTPPVTHVAG